MIILFSGGGSGMHNSVASGRDISSEVGRGFCGNGCMD